MIVTRGLEKNFRVHKKQPGLMGSVRALFKREWVDKKALNNVSLEVGAGEIVGIVGANGAGKTTLVKCLSGIIYPSGGSIDVLGYIPTERKNEFRKQISLIMGQKAQLWWDLPAADCFILLKEIYQIPECQFQETLEFLVETLQVRDQLNIQIRRLSLGERMKMELIAALLHRPRVVFLDEPTIGLDLTAQRAVRNFLLEYRKQYQPAMLLTSHYMADIEQLCERIIIFKEGSIVYDGSLDTLIGQHAPYKIVTAQLESTAAVTNLDIPINLGAVLESAPGLIKVKTARSQVAALSTFLLQNLSVVDLSIEESDISAIIESIIRREVS